MCALFGHVKQALFAWGSTNVFFGVRAHLEYKKKLIVSVWGDFTFTDFVLVFLFQTERVREREGGEVKSLRQEERERKREKEREHVDIQVPKTLLCATSLLQECAHISMELDLTYSILVLLHVVVTNGTELTCN